MARGDGKKERRAVKRRNHGATPTGRNNDQVAVPPKTPSGEKGDGLMFVNDESNGSAGDTTRQRIEEAQKKNGASFLKNRRKFRATLRMVGHDGKEVIDKSGRSRLPAPSTLDKWLLEEGKSAVFAVAGFKKGEERRSLVALSYDGESGKAYYERYDLDQSEAMPVLVVTDSCTRPTARSVESTRWRRRSE